MSESTNGKPTLKTIEGGRAQVERDIVRALAVGEDEAALAGMAQLERRAPLSVVLQQKASDPRGG